MRGYQKLRLIDVAGSLPAIFGQCFGRIWTIVIYVAHFLFCCDPFEAQEEQQKYIKDATLPLIGLLSCNIFMRRMSRKHTGLREGAVPESWS